MPNRRMAGKKSIKSAIFSIAISHEVKAVSSNVAFIDMSEARTLFANDALEFVRAANVSCAQLGSLIEKDYAGWRRVVAAQNLKFEAT